VGASVTLVTPSVSVEPGQSVSVELRVRNTGSVVDEFTFDVLGDAAGWATVEPPSISLFPGAEGNARAVFAPPRTAGTPAGTITFGLRARSKEDPAGSAVEEGTVAVGAFMDPFAELVPRTSRGSGSGSHDLAVDNRGNARLSAEIEATDADRQLRFDVKPPAVVVDPGMAQFAKIKVSPTKKFWRGQPKTRPFQLYVKPEGGLPITLEGTMLQEAVLPPWFLKALLALIALVILALIFWLFLLKPSIESAASEAVASPIASIKDEVNEALGAAGLPTMGPDDGGGAPTPPPTEAPPTEPGVTPAPPTPTPTPTADPGGGGTVIAGLGSPIDGRLDDDSRTYTSKGTTFITDLVFSNPNGQEGAIVILRGGSELLQLKLENFRDYDLHFVTPIVIPDGEQMNLSLACEDRTNPCDPAVFYSGYVRP
jgi:hypothetical protein